MPLHCLQASLFHLLHPSSSPFLLQPWHRLTPRAYLLHLSLPLPCGDPLLFPPPPPLGVLRGLSGSWSPPATCLSGVCHRAAPACPRCTSVWPRSCLSLALGSLCLCLFLSPLSFWVPSLRVTGTLTSLLPSSLWKHSQGSRSCLPALRENVTCPPSLVLACRSGSPDSALCPAPGLVARP